MLGDWKIFDIFVAAQPACTSAPRVLGDLVRLVKPSFAHFSRALARLIAQYKYSLCSRMYVQLTFPSSVLNNLGYFQTIIYDGKSNLFL